MTAGVPEVSEVPSPPAKFELDRVAVTFSGRGRGVAPSPALLPVTFTVRPGEFVSIVGPSGCGKSTALNAMAGLLTPTSGTIRFDGREPSGVSAEIGYLTQTDSLLPWLKSRDNVELALRLGGSDDSRAQRRARAMELLSLVGLDSRAGDRYPGELSGGMRKRVQIARLLAQAPDTVLMDEPFSGLDAQRRLLVLEEFLGMKESNRWTAVLVTHDPFEAVACSDRILAMSASPGRIVQEFEVRLPRPRDLEAVQATPEYQETFHALWALMRHEVAVSDGKA